MQEYQKETWNQYDLLFWILDYGEAAYGSYETERTHTGLKSGKSESKDGGWINKSANFYRMNVTQCVIDEYELATDDGGMAFFSQAVESVKNEVPYQAAEALYEKITGINNVEESADHPEETMNQAQRTITEERNRKKEENRQRQEQGEIVQPLEEVENPVETVSAHKTSAILAQTVEKPDALSVKALNLTDTVENRTKQEGNSPGYYNAGFYEKILYQKYLQDHFGCYTRSNENRVLDYELEYLLVGKASDQENLKSVVHRILAIRLAANLLYLLGDAAKMEEALAAATALVGFTGNPGIIELAKMGIVVAWAYAESILESAHAACGRKGSAHQVSGKLDTWAVQSFRGVFGNTESKRKRRRFLL